MDKLHISVDLNKPYLKYGGAEKEIWTFGYCE
jgi:hypothetical protein